MIHPDADCTSFHGKTGEFLTGMKKINDLLLSGLSCRHPEHRTGFNADANSAYQGLCALLRYLRSFSPESGAPMPLAILVAVS